jgi:hypothetical protein
MLLEWIGSHCKSGPSSKVMRVAGVLRALVISVGPVSALTPQHERG